MHLHACRLADKLTPKGELCLAAEPLRPLPVLSKLMEPDSDFMSSIGQTVSKAAPELYDRCTAQDVDPLDDDSLQWQVWRPLCLSC